MKNLEEKIGFDKIRNLLIAKCATQYAVSRVHDESFSTDRDIILNRLQLTDEMRLICMFEDSFPTDGYVDAKPFLVPLAAETSFIDLQSLVQLRTMLNTLRRITQFFKDSKIEIYPNLAQMTAFIPLYPEISRRIDLILDKFGNVKDNASEQLASIRKAIKDTERHISKQISSILNKAITEGIVEEGATLSVREGKTLIPVSVGNKKKLNGIVYDESASGRTAFVEPIEVVEMNNRIRELQFEEQREIVRILTDFSDFLRPYLPELISGAEFIGEIDFIHAKGVLATEMIAGLPIISDNREMYLRKARHPLLEKSLKKEHKEIVPLTLTLTPEHRILLISGPNAGGKSVCLKTVGLLQYMFQWGLLVPTSEISQMCIFDSIYIDIGDNQSIENDLSTYSSHLTAMREIVIRAGKKSLVLIDEFGSGTEPAAGGAIAESILTELEKNGAYGVITTHYTNLKVYASNSKGVVNGAMLFDAANIAPLFKLEQGLPGNSFAFELARKIGLPENIVKNAEEIAGESFVNMERQLRKIARNRKALDEKLIKVRSADKALEGLTEKYQKELLDIKGLKKTILDEARAEAKELLAEANREIEKTIRVIKESQAEKERTKEVRKELTQFSEKITNDTNDETDKKIEQKMQQILQRKERERKRKEARLKKSSEAASTKTENVPEERPLKIGDKVRIKDNDMIGEVVRISQKSISVAIGAITSLMDPKRVERISAQQFKELSRKASNRSYTTIS
ncbi:MAG: endonuclease MutS2, partial [Bacteroidales bacterium]|nr:endonuclease MutS2 [Bacteroidales bacterium]